jgi:hypothetical protein
LDFLPNRCRFGRLHDVYLMWNFTSTLVWWIV